MAQLGTKTWVLLVQAPGVTGTGGYVDYSDSVSSVTVDVDDSDPDFLSLAAARGAGASQFTLKVTMAQDTAAGSFWRLIWDSSGSKCNVKVNPYNTAAPTVGIPWYAGEITLAMPGGTILGSDADRSSTARATVDAEFNFTSKPTELTS
jgi:hypothetical protein